MLFAILKHGIIQPTVIVHQPFRPVAPHILVLRFHGAAPNKKPHVLGLGSFGCVGPFSYYELFSSSLRHKPPPSPFSTFRQFFISLARHQFIFESSVSSVRLCRCLLLHALYSARAAVLHPPYFIVAITRPRALFLLLARRIIKFIFSYSRHRVLSLLLLDLSFSLSRSLWLWLSLFFRPSLGFNTSCLTHRSKRASGADRSVLVYRSSVCAGQEKTSQHGEIFQKGQCAHRNLSTQDRQRKTAPSESSRKHCSMNRGS
jgi:hypothetical protein